jgi:hypothetical protein
MLELTSRFGSTKGQRARPRRSGVGQGGTIPQEASVLYTGLSIVHQAGSQRRQPLKP